MRVLGVYFELLSHSRESFVLMWIFTNRFDLARVQLYMYVFFDLHLTVSIDIIILQKIRFLLE